MKNPVAKISLVMAIIAAFVSFKVFDLGEYFSLDYLKANQRAFQTYYLENRVFTLAAYMILYITSTALSLPGAAVLTLAAGALFGFITGTIVVSFASTIGATLAFLASRFFLRQWVQKKIQEKFGKKIKTINAGIEREGAFYLFTLRLIPLFPFFLINLVMGLTPIKTFTFFWVSQIGMLAGTMVYVNAGQQLAQIDSLKGILSPPLLLSFCLLGLFPLLAKRIVNIIKARRVYRPFKGRRPKQYDYNMVVIGAGSAGLVTSYIATAIKGKVALIEKHRMGGDCLNTGCVPSKALIKSAKVIWQTQQLAKYGLLERQERRVDAEDVASDFPNIMDRIKSVIAKVGPHDSEERYRGLGVDCLTGMAKVISPWEVEVEGKKITAKNITLATGGHPFIPFIKGLESVNYLTSNTLWGLRELPKRFVVLGGGPIGLEIAQCFNRFGSQVTLVQRSSRILNKEDPDVSEIITKTFQREGIEVLLDHEAFEFRGNMLLCRCRHQQEKVKEIPFDRILIAVGRKANTEGWGREELGIALRPDGTLEANEYLQTNYPNIYTCGDVTGPFQLTHMAAHQAWYCAVNALLRPFKAFKVDYHAVPWCTYTDPEVATVGLNEGEAKRRGTPYEVTKYGIDDLDRAITDSEDRGFVKVLTVPGRDKILGATVVGASAGELITEFISAMKNNYGLNRILGTIHIYPTLSEANKYAAGVWKKAHAPVTLLKYAKKFHTWRRR